jgi:hypothetical protein
LLLAEFLHLRASAAHRRAREGAVVNVSDDDLRVQPDIEAEQPRALREVALYTPMRRV